MGGTGVQSLLYRGPYFTLEPPALVEFTNSSGAEVRCQADGSPKPSVRWETASGVRASQDGTLTVRPFSAESYRQGVQAAFYRCVAANVVGSVASRLVHVLGLLDERLQARAQDDVVIRGSSAVLRCKVGRSQAPYSAFDAWIRDDGYSISRPTYKEERYSVLQTGELLIHRTNMADTERTYRCRVRHTVSGDTALSSNVARAIVIDIGESASPRMSLFRNVVRVSVGRTVDMPCVVTGFPPANVTWFRHQSRKLQTIVDTGGVRQVNGVLTFEEVKQQHEGTYVCVASNELGEIRAEAGLFVKETVSLALMPNYQVVEPGMSAKLNCTTTTGSVDLSEVTWYKDGRPLKTDVLRVRLETMANLVIRPVEKRDAGMYQCFVGGNLEMAQASAEIAVAETAPSLTQTFYQRSAKPGESISLQCQSKGRPLPTFSWERDQELLLSDRRVRITSVHISNQVISVLNITRVYAEDSGLYGCRATNEAGSVAHWARVGVHGKVFVHQGLSNVTAVPGQDVRIQCRYGGFPVDSVSWYKDDVLLPRNVRHSLDNDGNLRIRDFMGSVDAGDYTCVVKSRDQEVRATTQLVLVVPPVIDDHFFPETITVDEGSRSRLLCSVSKGDGPLRFQWFKDGQLLSSVPDGSVQYSDDSAMIKFRKVRFRDRGKYTCFATNDAAGDNRTTDVVVNVSPRIKVAPQNSTTSVGGQVMLDCVAEGFPTPVVTWQKFAEESGSGGSGFEDLRLNFRSYVLPNGSLWIGDAEEFDEGLLRCRAHNDIGAPVSREVSLHVREPPQFKERFKVLYVRRGETFQAHCSTSSGDAPIAFTWEKNYRPLNCSRCVTRNNSDGSDLTLLGTIRSDSAVYACIARNGVGEDVTFLQVVVQESPDAPWGLMLTNHSSRTASLLWHAPYDGNSDILKYKVQYKLEQELLSGFGREIVVPAGETTATLTNLHPVSTYEIRVVAENAFGASAPSNVTVVTTKEEAPSGPPVSVSLYTTGSQSLKVTWRPPSRDQHHGVILGYHVGYRVADGAEPGAPSVKQVDSRGANSSHGLETTYLTNLRRLTKYAVTVQAYNGAGRGPSSEEVYATTLETAPPTSPSVQVEPHSTTSILVQWKKDPKDRSENTEYVLHYGGDDGDWKSHQLAAHERQFLLQNLRCGSQYRLYVTASNSLGMGEPGEEAVVRTRGSPPVAPSKEGLIVANKTSALLRLGRWGDGGCPVDRFVLQYRQKLEPAWAAVAQTVAPPPQGEHLLTGLAPGKVYELSVVAHNDAGATRAEYDFVTLSPKATKTKTEPMSGSSGGFRFPLQENLVFIVPALLSALVVLLVLVFLYFYWRKQAPVADTASEKELPGRKVYAEESFIISELPRKAERSSQDPQGVGGSIFDPRAKRNYHIYTTNQSVL
ncbi:hypothetical protein ISCGN_026224 [Ixodes scapularis]